MYIYIFCHGNLKLKLPGSSPGQIILTLIKHIKREIPDITHPWYYDDAGALGTFTRIETYFNPLTHQGPGRGYHPELSKSVLLVHTYNIEAIK